MSSDDSPHPRGSGNFERPTRIRWLVLSLAAGTSLMLYVHRYTWAIIRPELAREYGFTNTQLEQIFTFFNFSYAVGQIPGGIICDFFGARFFLGSIIVGWSLSLVLFALVGSFWTFCIARLIFGATQAGAYPSLSSVSRHWFPLSQRTTMQGFVASFAGRAGGALAPIIMATVLMGYMNLPWRTALIIMASGGLFLGAAFVYLYRNSPYHDQRVNEAEKDLFRDDSLSEKSKKKVLNFKAAIKSRSLSIMVFAQLSNAGADIVYTSVLGSFFLSKEISWEELGIYASLPLFGGAFGGFAGGFLNDWVMKITGSRKWGRRIMGSTGKVIAAIFVFVAIAQTNVAFLAIGLFVVKFFSDWSQPTVWGTCTDIGGPYSATVFSIVNTAGNVGAIIVSLFVLGPLLDSYTTIEIINGESKTVTDYFPMFVMVAGLYLVTAVCWLCIDCTKQVDPENA